MVATGHTNGTVGSFNENRLLQMGKVIHDELRKSVDTHLSNAEAGIALRVGKALEAEVTKQLSRVSETQFEEVKALREEFYAETKRLHDECMTSVNGVKELLNAGMEQIKSFLQALPQPPIPQVTVNVPELRQPEINVKMEPVFTVPSAIPPEVIVNVPQQKSIVNVAAPQVTNVMPELKQPEIRVEVPQAKRMKKSILYDQFNRPTEVTEEEV